MPDNGKAEPQSAKSEAVQIFPAKATADFLQEVQQVTGHGKFANRGANGMLGTPSSTQNQAATPALTFAQAYWVFDITTGNLLMMGGYGS